MACSEGETSGKPLSQRKGGENPSAAHSGGTSPYRGGLGGSFSVSPNRGDAPKGQRGYAGEQRTAQIQTHRTTERSALRGHTLSSREERVWRKTRQRTHGSLETPSLCGYRLRLDESVLAGSHWCLARILTSGGVPELRPICSTEGKCRSTPWKLRRGKAFSSTGSPPRRRKVRELRFRLWAKSSVHFLAPPLPAKPATLGFGGAPIGVRSRKCGRKLQPFCKNPLSCGHPPFRGNLWGAAVLFLLIFWLPCKGSCRQRRLRGFPTASSIFHRMFGCAPHQRPLCVKGAVSFADWGIVPAQWNNKSRIRL